MIVADMLTPQRIKIPLRGGTKTEVITELVDTLAANGDISDAAGIRRAVLQRERTASTCIGHGLALPHAKTDRTDRSLLALGRTVEPVEFGDGHSRPVTLVVLLIGPPEDASRQIQLLAHLSRLMSIDRLRRQLNRAMTPREVIDVIASQEGTAT
ncbi:MAG: PTS sugar transporter subunit IIA [Planctomycetota bacterium]